MGFDPKDYLPKATNWFETEIFYEGLGRAEFEDPIGWVEGPAKVQFDESGRSAIELKIDNQHIEQSAETGSKKDDLDWLLTGSKPDTTTHEGWVQSGVNINHVCSKLTIKTKNGIFENLDVVRIRRLWQDQDTLELSTLRSSFTRRGDLQAKYWVMPLLNFVYEPNLSRPYTEFINHPLRIYPVPDMPEELSDEQKKQAIAHSWRNIEMFSFENKPAFIEPLPNFKELKEKIERHQQAHAITSIVVGETNNHSTEFEDLAEWFPLGLLPLLSLATGNLVGSPWIEFHDSNGQFLKRIHNPIRVYPYLVGHTCLDNFTTNLSYFLNKAYGKLDAKLRTAISLTVHGGQKHLDIEDRKAFFFRAMDTINEYRGKPKTAFIEAQRSEQIRQVLDDATQKIYHQRPKKKTDQFEFISRIAEIVKKADDPKNYTDAEAVLETLEQLGLHDAKVIRRELSEKEWRKRYKDYRNHVIHDGFIPFNDKKYDMIEIYDFMSHIHDILLRIILKKLNYDGTYKRAIRLQERVSIDWINPDTPASELGSHVTERKSQCPTGSKS